LGQDLKYYQVVARHDPAGDPRKVCVGRSDSRTDFPDTDITTFFFTHQLTTIDNYLWVSGGNGVGVPLFMALPQGVNIPSGPSGLWVDRSATYPYAGNGYQGQMLIRKAATEGALYVAFAAGGLANKAGCFRAASTNTAISTGFTEQTNVGTRFASTTLGGYGVSDDGQVQLMSTDQGVYRSTNAGVTWTVAITGLDTVIDHCEFRHVPAFGAGCWVMCNNTPGASGKGVWFTSNNAANWTRASLLGTNTQPTSFYLDNIERLDSQGRVLVGFAGLAPCKVYISLNGGTKWAFVTSLIPPYYDMDVNPEALSTTPAVICINDGNRLTLIWPGETGDEGVFVSDSFGPVASFYPTDPNVWSR
jgi:hypothetical protein